MKSALALSEGHTLVAVLVSLETPALGVGIAYFGRDAVGLLASRQAPRASASTIAEFPLHDKVPQEGATDRRASRPPGEFPVRRVRD